MKIVINPLGRQVNEFLMKAALPLGLWFIVEQLVRYQMSHNVMLSMLLVPMMALLPFALWWILRRLRRQVLGDAITWMQAWSFGTQLMFFSGLIEALFIYTYNEFLVPGNLLDMQQGLLMQTEQSLKAIQDAGIMAGAESQLRDAIEQMRQMPIASPIESAINQLSSDIFYGMMLMIPIAFLISRKPKN